MAAWADRRRLGPKVLGAGLALAILAGAAFLIMRTADRLRAVEGRLASAEARSQAVLKQMNAYSRELELALQRAEASRLRADQSQGLRTQAEANAARAQAAADHARGETEQARTNAARAQGEAQQARNEAEQARAQAEELRVRRQEELNRMQEALNLIAPTRRTPLGMVVELASESFKFDFDKATLRPENREMLSRIAGVLLASSGYRLDVYGYTDDVGTVEYNQNLSERRAEAVAGYLTKAGVPPDIVHTRGYGKASPRAQGTTRDARQRNRRVEIGIVDTVINYQVPDPGQSR